MTATDEFRDEAERMRVVATARGEGEYDVFAAAWEAWHGTGPPPGQIEADFGAYLRGQSIPPYVRHFVRQWLAENPRVRRRRAADRRAARRAQLLTLAVIVLAVLVALLLADRL